VYSSVFSISFFYLSVYVGRESFTEHYLIFEGEIDLKNKIGLWGESDKM
jgi:hypothetical protein